MRKLTMKLPWELAMEHARAVYNAWALCNGVDPSTVVHPDGGAKVINITVFRRWEGKKAFEYLEFNGHTSVEPTDCKCGARY